LPLYPDARNLIRKNLEALQIGQRVPRIAVGRLTKIQIETVNAQQSAEDLPLSIEEVVFVGRHIHKRRILKDEYTIDDVIDQIDSALSEGAEVIANDYMTAIRNPIARIDRLGDKINDEAILECSKYRPNPDVFSVIPKGDKIKPQKQKAAESGLLPNKSSDSPG
jgi:hypothetical protein